MPSKAHIRKAIRGNRTIAREAIGFEEVVSVVHFLLHTFLSIASLNAIMGTNKALMSIFGKLSVWALHSSEYIQAGDIINHLSSHYQGLRGYEGRVLEVHSNSIRTDLLFAPNLTDFDRVAKAGWPFYKLHSQTFFVQVSVCFRDLRFVPLKPGKVSGKQNHGTC